MKYLVRFEVECTVKLEEDGRFPNDLAIIDQAVKERLIDPAAEDVRVKPCHVEPIIDMSESIDLEE